MDFVLPTASNERLEELLVYLGDRAEESRKHVKVIFLGMYRY